MKNPFRKRRYPVLEELEKAVERVEKRRDELTTAENREVMAIRMAMATHEFDSAEFYAKHGMERKRLGASFVEEVEQKAMEIIEGNNDLVSHMERDPDSAWPAVAAVLRMF